MADRQGLYPVFKNKALNCPTLRKPHSDLIDEIRKLSNRTFEESDPTNENVGAPARATHNIQRDSESRPESYVKADFLARADYCFLLIDPAEYAHLEEIDSLIEMLDAIELDADFEDEDDLSIDDGPCDDAACADPTKYALTSAGYVCLRTGLVIE